MNKVWSESEKKYLMDNCGVVKDTVLASQMSTMTGRKISVQSLRKQRQKLGLLKKPGRGKCQLRNKEINNDTDKPE